ncbi:MAG: 50S ribosomal protein L13 [Thermoanaerobaculia bacterium]
MKSTVSPKPAEIERAWYVVDGTGVPVGRLSTTVAKILLGKGKPLWAPHVDCGDFVIVINADKVALSGSKEQEKVYYRHRTQKPGSLKSPRAFEVRAKKPIYLVENSVYGMLPKTKLGRKIRKKLKVYAGAEHPHQAQKPQTLDLAAAKM